MKNEITLVRKVIKYVDKATGEEKTFTKYVLVLNGIEVDIKPSSNDDAQRKADYKILKAFADAR